jgi:enoyl-CoA hydratase/carnithine racemase
MRGTLMYEQRNGGDADVELEFDGRIAYLRLNRPEQLNAFSGSLITALGEALDRIEQHDDCRVIVVCGNGRAFSAGGDLKEFEARVAANDYDGMTDFVDLAAQTLTRLEENARPVIAAVGGLAVAGGFELILCCDIVLAAEGVMLGDGHLRYAVLPGGGGAARLVRKLPPNVASRLLLTGELVPAEYLCSLGLVNEVLPPEELDARAAELAARIAALSPLALSHVKRVAREAAVRPAVEGLQLELDAFASYVESPDFREGLRAFGERRDPHFPPIGR